MRRLLEVLFKRRRSIVWVALLSVVLAFLTNLLSTPQYTSEARIHVGLGREMTVPTRLLNQPLNVYLDRNEQVNTQIELLVSRHLVEKTLRELVVPEEQKPEGILGRARRSVARGVVAVMGGVRSVLARIRVVAPTTQEQRTILDMMRRIQVNRARSTDILTVSFTHSDPVFARVFLEHYLQNYLGSLGNINGEQESMKVFSGQVAERDEALRKASQKLSEFRRRWNIYDLPAQKELLAHEIMATGTELRKVDLEIVAGERKVREFREGLQTSVENAIPEEMRTDYAITELLKNLVGLKVQLNRMLENHGPRHPDVEGMNARIEHLRARLADEVSGILKNQLSARQSRRIILQEQSDLQKKLAQELDEKGLEMEVYEREVTLLRQAARNYAEREETSRVNTVLDGARVGSVSLVQPPLAPLKPSSPRYFLNLLLAMLLGILLGVVQAFGAEHLSGTVNTPEEMRRLLGIGAVVFIPEDTARGDLEGENS